MKHFKVLTSVLILVVLCFSNTALSQDKKPLKHSDYDGWKSLSGSTITDDGSWIKYEINPQQGDGNLYLYNVKANTEESFERGINASFSANSEFFVFLVKPTFAETRQAKKDKKKGDALPKNKLGIKSLPSGEVNYIDRIKSFQLAEDDGSWMAYHKEKPLPKKKVEDNKNNEEQETEVETPQRPGGQGSRARNGAGNKAKGTDLVIYNPVEEKEHLYTDVVEYKVAKSGTSIAFIQETTDTTKISHFTVSVFSTSDEQLKEIFKGDGSLKKLTVNDQGDKFAFIYTSDTSKVKVYDLYLSSGATAEKIVAPDTPGMLEAWSVSENGSLSFTESGNRLFFGTALEPVEEPEDTLLDDEKFKLDVWNWQDPYLQPQQKINASRDQRATFQAVYHIADRKMVQLATEEIPSVRVLMKRDGDLAIGSSNLDYRKMVSWDNNRYTDYYLVDVKTGKSALLLEAAPSSVFFSPSGKYLVYWCIKNKAWFARPTAGGESVNLTKELDVTFFNELHDSPSEPRPHGIAGWIEGENYVLIYDRYDIWKMDVSGKEAPVMITNGFGRENNIRFRYETFEGRGGFRGFGGGGSDEKLYIGAKEEVFMTAFNYYTKQSGLYSVKINKPANPSKITMGDFSYRSYAKAKDANKLIFQRGTFKDYPELYISDLKLSNPVKISNTNPQQSEYNWGTVELVDWMSFDGQKLQGLLYKPENFNPNKKYPMIVYFYERSSDGLHSYYVPNTVSSTINRSYVVSNEYLIFVPDIPYVEGYPGQSCYNAVVSGTYSMLDRFNFIDEKRLGLDGHSWGGYQIAYLITETDLFACAYSGAPVSNMTSAYGGIRWASGMSRMFQYEQTQSRIGGTLWEKPIHFIENSPIFFVPKINTPVLILHNDDDGAVPWYQGIEFFVALRRLEKPAWMLVYNGEGHGTRKRPNRIDLTIRKMQFFDHYLQGAAAPEWMVKGIPAVDKGKKDGYKLIEE